MAEHGARHLTFISRSGASSAEAASTVSELEEMGVQTTIFQSSVTEKSDLLAVVRQTSNARAIKGVLHAAMVEGVRVAIPQHVEHQIFSQRSIRTHLLKPHPSNRYKMFSHQKFKELLIYTTRL